MGLRTKFFILHFCTHALSLAGLVWVFRSGQFYWLLLSIVCYLYFGIVGVNVSLHRYFSHNSFRTSRFGYWILFVSSFFPMLGSPAAWGSFHRLHHVTSDTDNDPHCPQRLGYFKSWFANWPNSEVPISLFRSFARDKNVMFLDKYYFEIIVLWVMVLALIDWRLVMFAFAIPAIGCFHGASAIAVLPHIDCPGSYRSYPSKDLSRNCFFSSILSLGEGWHNNHHAHPSKYRQGEKWWELDPAACLIENIFIVRESSR